MYLLSSKKFLIYTLIFIVFAVVAFGYFLPKILSQISQAKQEDQSLTEQLEQSQTYKNRLVSLKKQENDLNTLHQKALDALPISPNNELVLLGLDALLKENGLQSATIVAPNSTSAAPIAVNDNDIRAGSSGSPIVNPKQSQNSVTINGNMSYNDALKLIAALKNFARWNKITAIDISNTGNNATASITTAFFSAPAAQTYSAKQPDLIAKASTIFDSLKNYTLPPDSKTEGSYGKANPFAP